MFSTIAEIAKNAMNEFCKTKHNLLNNWTKSFFTANLDIVHPIPNESPVGRTLPTAQFAAIAHPCHWTDNTGPDLHNPHNLPNHSVI
jgi:hypothetical protein